METSTKIDFSEEELGFMKNATVFPMKHIITSKVEALFYQLSGFLINSAKHHSNEFPERVQFLNPKISRGERYLNQPYLILDLPRLFNKENVFAFRTMFWWGHYFSFTFHISGNLMGRYKLNFQKNYQNLKGRNFFLCINNNEWEHSVKPSNYSLIDDLDNREIQHLSSRYFIKIARKLEIDRFDELSKFGLETFEMIFATISQ